MLTLKQLQTVYEYVSVYSKKIRFPLSTFHKKYSAYSGLNTTTNLLKKARDAQVLIGPFMYTNTGTEVELFFEEDYSVTFDRWTRYTSDPSVTYAVFLTGAHSLLVFRNGADMLSYANAIKPTYPSSYKIKLIFPTKVGKLDSDPYPHGWEELDWAVFHYMRDPMISFPKVADKIRNNNKIRVTWQTVQNHFNKIVKSCRPWISFFPMGLPNYFHVFMTFETDFEIGIYEELSKLDRTSYIYKCGKTIMLFLYTHSSQEHSVFLNLKKEGIIHDLHVSTPVQWHKPWFEF